MSHAEKPQVDVTKVDIQAVAAPRGNRKSTWAGKLWDTFDAPPDVSTDILLFYPSRSFVF